MSKVTKSAKKVAAKTTPRKKAVVKETPKAKELTEVEELELLAEPEEDTSVAENADNDGSNSTASMEVEETVEDVAEEAAEDEAEETPESGDALQGMTIEQLQAELLKRTGKNEPAAEESKSSPDKAVTWVKFLDYQKDEKLLRDLTKINKMTVYKMHRVEMSKSDLRHRVRMFPIDIEELQDPFIQKMLKKCITSNVQIRLTEDKDIVGMLVLLFKTVSDVKENLPQLQDFKPGVKVCYELQADEWRQMWSEATGARNPAVHGNMSDFAVMLPSLPPSLTESELWDFFPTALMVCLVEAKPKNHAFVDFASDKASNEAVEALNARGRVKDDFKFCGLIRIKRLTELINKDTGKTEPASKTGSKPSSARPMITRAPPRPTSSRGRGGNSAMPYGGKRGASSFGGPPMKRSMGGPHGPPSLLGAFGDHDSWDAPMMGQGGMRHMGHRGGGNFGMGNPGRMNQSTEMKLREAMEKLGRITRMREQSMHQQSMDDGYYGGGYY